MNNTFITVNNIPFTKQETINIIRRHIANNINLYKYKKTPVSLIDYCMDVYNNEITTGNKKLKFFIKRPFVRESVKYENYTSDKKYYKGILLLDIISDVEKFKYYIISQIKPGRNKILEVYAELPSNSVIDFITYNIMYFDINNIIFKDKINNKNYSIIDIVLNKSKFKDTTVDEAVKINNNRKITQVKFTYNK